MTSEKEDRLVSIVAGTTKSHRVWLETTDVVLNYQEYLEVINGIIEQMAADLPEIDGARFTNDVSMLAQNIFRNREGAPQELLDLMETIEVPRFKLTSLTTGQQETRELPVNKLEKVVVTTDKYTFFTTEGELRVVDREIYEAYSQIVSEAEEKKHCIEAGIEYILENDDYTIASVMAIIRYAGMQGKYFDQTDD
ncbi:hypothetical protein [Xylocopilactobacillus apicola]|uniref:Uncharacterized protein n=1 Tax=Xylocopilactobacillus apicola TaxID=2932184 RepID=A0AAU9D334_9LACO|nr:hypothetical protein [Xylocopilactobacillus apicola]BDR59226.1 hypothetical protein XA3_16670 [Xylocopilactobacillus apicola]